MPELPITPHAVTATSSRSNNASRPNSGDAAETDEAAGTPASFATALKSIAEKKPARSSKSEPSADDHATAPESIGMTISPKKIPDLSSNYENLTPPVDSSALLLLLQANASPLTATADHIASPARPAENSHEMPIFFIGQGTTQKKMFTAPQVVLATDVAEESRVIPLRLAAKAAISAEPPIEDTININNNAASRQSQETFITTVMDRAANHDPITGLANPTGIPPRAQGLHLETPLGQATWRDEFGQKLTWMVSNNRQQADLVLNPPQLGRIEVTLSLDGNQASASFASPHAAVREALENAMARLREVLADAGVTLGQTHVGYGSQRDSYPMNQENDSQTPISLVEGLSVAGLGSSRIVPSSRIGMVDVFA